METCAAPTRPLTPLMASPFGEKAVEGWPAFTPDSERTPPSTEPPSRAASASPGLPAHTALNDSSRSGSLSLTRSMSLSRAVKPKAPPPLWRTSTAVSDHAASLGYTSVAAMCAGSFVPPERLKKIKSLGEGAFAEVEMAHLLPAGDGGDGSWPSTVSRQPGKPPVVAVKRLKPHVLEAEDDVVAFIQEARLLLTLQHPSVIQYIGLGCDDASCMEAQWRTMYLVQEYAGGGTLKRIILKQMINPTRKLYSLQDAVQWSRELAEGLAYLHSQNPMVLHRDLKAENVLLLEGAGGQLYAKLGDFGLHKMVPKPPRSTMPRDCGDIREEGSTHGGNDAFLQLNASSSLSKLSSTLGLAGNKVKQLKMAGTDAQVEDTIYEMTGQTGAFVYMAPEVLLGNDYNEKVDVFSFGVILYELLHRKMIVAELMYLGSAEDAEAYAYQVAAGFRKPIDPSVPAGLGKLIQDCLAGIPELRPSMKEVVQRLQAVQESGEVEALEHLHGPNSQAGCCTIM